MCVCLNSHVYKYLYVLARAWGAFSRVVVGVKLRTRLLIAMLHLSVISRINGCGFGPGRGGRRGMWRLSRIGEKNSASNSGASQGRGEGLLQ